MVTQSQIQDLANRIAAEFQPQRIVLFGSRATGGVHTDSDVDLLVVMSFDGPVLRKTVEMLDSVDPSFAVDLLLHTPEEANWRYQGGDPLVCEAFDRGVVLYEAAA